MQQIDPTPQALTAAVATGETLVLFHATWCPFCRAFAPRFREAAPRLAPLRAGEVLLDDEDNPLWTELAIDVVPTLIRFRAGQPMARRDARAGVGLTVADLEALLAEPGDG